MSGVRLDQAADALAATLERCRQSVDLGQARRLSTTITVNPQGQPESLSWECRLPSGDGNERRFELLRLPWASLQQADMLELSHLSIALDCVIKTADRRDGTEPTRYTAIPVDKDRTMREATHHIQVTAQAGEPKAAVSIDGLSVEAFLAARQARDNETTWQWARSNRFFFVLTLLVVGAVCAAAFFLFYR